MPRRIHLLNVSPGDCSIIEHLSGRRTMIDICSGNAEEIERAIALESANNRQKSFNYRMCERLTNPVEYAKTRGWAALFRFILTHPDMDHMDGLKRLVDEVGISNFWDTGAKRDKPSFESYYRYKEEDWDIYDRLRTGAVAGVTSLTKLAGASFSLANEAGKEGQRHDGLQIVAPSAELLNDPNESDDINEASYIVSYRASTGKFVFSGDAHDASWEYALEHHNNDLTNCAFLLAPHHGRDSGRSYDFLDRLRPKWTWIGCAPSKYIDYNQWDRRGLDKNMSNQTGNVILELSEEFYDIYIENERYALDNQSGPLYSHKNDDGYTFLKRIQTK